MAVATATAREPVARWKAAWSDPWIDLPRGSFAIDDEITEGASNGAGSATLTVWHTVDCREEGAPVATLLPRDAFVQIGAEDRDAPESDTDRIRWLWIGYVADSPWEHLGTEPTDGDDQPFIVRYDHRLEGLGGLFHRITLQRAQIRANGSPVLMPTLPIFNGGTDGQIRGNRSLTALGDGSFPFDLGRGASSGIGQFTARQALDRLIADHLTGQFPSWPTFALTGQLAALDYVDSFKLDGMRLGEALTELAGIGRGCTWTVEPDATGTGTVNIRITSALPQAVDVPGLTLPASDRLVSAIDTGDSHFRLSSSLTDRARRWTVRGQARTTLTLAILTAGGAGSALLRGWDTGLEGSFSATDPRFSLFWRFYRLNPGWNGLTWNGADGIAQSLEQAGGAYTGVRLLTGGPASVEAARLDGEMVIPGLASTDGRAINPVSLATWASTPATPLAWDAPPERIRVWAMTGTDPATAVEITDQIEINAVSDPAPGIMLGRSIADIATIRPLVEGKNLLMTCTVIEPLPVLVGRAPSGTAAVDQVIDSPTAVVHAVAAGTFLGLTGTTPITVSGTRLIRDDRPRVSALLAGLGPYLDRAGTATVEHRLDHLPASHPWRPGAYVQTVEDGRGPSFATSLRAVITGRAWRFGPGYGTRIMMEALSLNLRSYV